MRFRALYITAALALTACVETPPPPPPVAAVPPAPPPKPPNPYIANEQIFDRPSLNCRDRTHQDIALYPDQGATYKLRAMACASQQDDLVKTRTESLPSLHPAAYATGLAYYTLSAPAGMSGSLHIVCAPQSSEPALISASLFHVVRDMQEAQLEKIEGQLREAAPRFCENGIANRQAVIDSGRLVFNMPKPAPKPPAKKPVSHKTAQHKKG